MGKLTWKMLKRPLKEVLTLPVLHSGIHTCFLSGYYVKILFWKHWKYRSGQDREGLEVKETANAKKGPGVCEVWKILVVEPW